jgi:hypothetical protein
MDIDPAATVAVPVWGIESQDERLARTSHLP